MAIRMLTGKWAGLGARGKAVWWFIDVFFCKDMYCTFNPLQASRSFALVRRTEREPSFTFMGGTYGSWKTIER